MLKSFVWPRETSRVFKNLNKVAPNGIFATGIENSDPVVDGRRRNQLKEAHDFYKNWETRIEQIHALGIKWLRFGEGYSFTHLGKDHYNFDLTEKVIKKCDRLGINLMIDLLHFGLPDWMHKNNPKFPYFQNPDFPYHFAEYVKVFTKYFPTVKYFTPVNEPMVTAKFSALTGNWNEQLKDEKNYTQAVTNIAKAAVLAKETIENVWMEEKREGEPVFFQNDSFEKAIAGAGLSNKDGVDKFNKFLRFAALDLIFGHKDVTTKKYFLKNGLSENDYKWFMQHGNVKNTVLGIDHYPWCINEYTNKGIISKTPKDEYQPAAIVKEYWLRYPLPLMHMEVNAVPDHAEDIISKTYSEMSLLHKKGYPVLGLSWFGDDVQIGWQTLLANDEEYRVGLFYKGEKEPIAELFMEYALQGLSRDAAYKKLFLLYPPSVDILQATMKRVGKKIASKTIEKSFSEIIIPLSSPRLKKLLARTREY